MLPDFFLKVNYPDKKKQIQIVSTNFTKKMVFFKYFSGVTVHDVPSGKQYLRTTPQP